MQVKIVKATRYQTSQQPSTEARIAAIEAWHKTNYQPEEGDVVKKEAVTHGEAVWGSNRGNPGVTC